MISIVLLKRIMSLEIFDIRFNRRFYSGGLMLVQNIGTAYSSQRTDCALFKVTKLFLRRLFDEQNRASRCSNIYNTDAVYYWVLDGL